MTNRGNIAIRFDIPIIAAAILSVVGVVGLGAAFGPGPDAASPSHPAAGEGLDGSVPAVAVVDGDTIELDGRLVRLAHIDAPELGQACDEGGHLTVCGREAAYALRKLIAFDHRKPECAPAAGTDGQTCAVGSVDPALALLERGLATASSQAPAAYRTAEARARAVPLGIWKGSFVPPAEWRTGRRLPAETDAVRAAASPTDWPWRVAGVAILPEPLSHRDPCVIKGVVTVAGERRYFGPLDPGYAAIDVASGGGRAFCSDDEAVSAGWSHGHSAGRWRTAHRQ